ncbi:MAG: hypothetical protein WA156_06510, partial [Methylocystis silviterrae]
MTTAACDPAARLAFAVKGDREAAVAAPVAGAPTPLAGGTGRAACDLAGDAPAETSFCVMPPFAAAARFTRNSSAAWGFSPGAGARG